MLAVLIILGLIVVLVLTDSATSGGDPRSPEQDRGLVKARVRPPGKPFDRP